MKKKEDIRESDGLRLSPSDAFVRRFSNATKRARIFKGVTQHELASKLKVPQSTVALFESGGNLNPKIGFVCDIAEALGMKIGYRPFLRKPGPEIKIDGFIFDE